MNNKDLEYLFTNTSFNKKNYYPKGVTTNTQDLHLKYLRKSHFKFNSEKTDNKYVKNINLFRLDGTLITTVKNPQHPTNSKLGRYLTINKVKTEKYLKRFGIRTPKSRIYKSSEINLAKAETFKNSNNPVVIKPLNASLGRGVVTNVTQDRFDESWQISQSFAEAKNRPIIVQDYIEGFEARATIIEGELMSIVVRIPPYVIGDGVSTIEELIKYKNQERQQCGYLSYMPINKSERISEYLKSNNLNYESIPSKEAYVLLLSISNTSNGGELMDITNIVSDEVLKLPLQALASIPGLFTGGLDIMLRSFDDIDPLVLEINTYPVIALATYPTYGQGKDLAQKYFESVFSIDQFIFEPPHKYNIINNKIHIKHYLKFVHLRNEMMNNNFDKLKSLV